MSGNQRRATRFFSLFQFTCPKQKKRKPWRACFGSARRLAALFSCPGHRRRRFVDVQQGQDLLLPLLTLRFVLVVSGKTRMSFSVAINIGVEREKSTKRTPLV